jgi:hypothetical protein
VLHRSPESKEVGDDQAKAEDLIGIQNLFNELGMRDMIAGKALIGWRRLGKSNGMDRTLLQIFKQKAAADRD